MVLGVILTIVISIVAAIGSALSLRGYDQEKVAASEGDITACIDQLTELEKKAAAGAIDGVFNRLRMVCPSQLPPASTS